MKLDLLTNATVVDDAIRFVSEKSKDKKKSLANSNEHEKEESKEPDSDEDKLQQEVGEEQREEIATLTTNQVF
jgi:hypothetical protein